VHVNGYVQIGQYHLKILLPMLHLSAVIVFLVISFGVIFVFENKNLLKRSKVAKPRIIGTENIELESL